MKCIGCGFTTVALLLEYMHFLGAGMSICPLLKLQAELEVLRYNFRAEDEVWLWVSGFAVLAVGLVAMIFLTLGIAVCIVVDIRQGSIPFGCSTDDSLRRNTP